MHCISIAARPLALRGKTDKKTQMLGRFSCNRCAEYGHPAQVGITADDQQPRARWKCTVCCNRRTARTVARKIVCNRGLTKRPNTERDATCRIAVAVAAVVAAQVRVLALALMLCRHCLKSWSGPSWRS